MDPPTKWSAAWVAATEAPELKRTSKVLAGSSVPEGESLLRSATIFQSLESQRARTVCTLDASGRTCHGVLSRCVVEEPTLLRSEMRRRPATSRASSASVITFDLSERHRIQTYPTDTALRHDFPDFVLSRRFTASGTPGHPDRIILTGNAAGGDPSEGRSEPVWWSPFVPMPASLASPSYAVLSAMITPAIFLTANGSLIISTSNRMSRVVDRIRVLNDLADKLCRGVTDLDFSEDRLAMCRTSSTVWCSERPDPVCTDVPLPGLRRVRGNEPDAGHRRLDRKSPGLPADVAGRAWGGADAVRLREHGT